MISDLAGQPDRLKTCRGVFEYIFTIAKLESYAVEGIMGVVMHGKPKAGPNHASVFIYMAITETPRGRTTLTCATTQAEPAEGIKVFDQLRTAVNAP